MGVFTVIASSGMLPSCDGMIERGALNGAKAPSAISSSNALRAALPNHSPRVSIEGLEAQWLHDSYCGRKDT